MKKFESNHKDIEYCKASKPNLLYMNRQVRLILKIDRFCNSLLQYFTMKMKTFHEFVIKIDLKFYHCLT